MDLRRILLMVSIGMATACPDAALDPDKADAPTDTDEPDPQSTLPPPILFTSTEPVLDGEGLVEHHVTVDADAPDGTFQVNLTIDMKNVGDEPLRITKVIPHWTGHDEGDLVATAGDLFSVDDDAYTVLKGEQFRTVGAGAEQSVGEGTLGSWTDVNVDTLAIHAVGRVFDSGSQVVFGGFRTPSDGGAMLDAVRAFPDAPTSNPGPLLGSTVTACVSGVVSSPAGGDVFRIAPYIKKDLTPSKAFDALDVVFPNGCTVHRVGGGVREWVETTDTSNRIGWRMVYAGEVDCGATRRGFVALVNPDTLTMDKLFGGGEPVLFDGLYEGLLHVDAVAVNGIVKKEPFTFTIATSQGAGCADGAPKPDTTCRSALLRLDVVGDVATDWSDSGWREIVLPDAVSSFRVQALAGATDKIVLGGWADQEHGGTLGRHWLLGRLSASGSWDLTFGITKPEGDGDIDDIANPNAGSGYLIHRFSGRFGAIEDVAVTDDAIVAAGWSLFGGEDTDVAVGRYTLAGAEIGGDDGFRTWWVDPPSATAASVAIDPDGGAITVGKGPLGGWGIARHRPDGKLDSTDWMDPDEVMRLRLPDGRFFATAPTQLELQVFAEGYENPAVLQLPLTVHEPTGNGAYLFPLDVSTLPADAWIEIGQHHQLGTAHQESYTQRYALDIAARRKVGDTWSSVVEGGEDDKNEDRVIYGVDIVAMDDGEIVRCFRELADNPKPGVEDEAVKSISGGGNDYFIRHSTGEVALYAHMQPGSQPKDLCPTEGLQAVPIPVERGQFLGRVGNSGSSTAPHLHVHVQRGYAVALPGDPEHGGVPLVVKSLRSQALSESTDGTWFELSNQALAPSTRVE